jgi:hypothetical protein
MEIRILQWNISNRCNSQLISAYINAILKQHTIVNLQEVTQNAYFEICSILKPTSSAFSLDLRVQGKYEGKNRSLGVATLSFGIELCSFELIHRSVFPERTLFSKFKYLDDSLFILNFHSLTGVDYKKAKSSNFASIAGFMEQNDKILDFACFDANEPEIDSMEEDNLKFWDNRDKGYNASLILGKNKVHGLEDSYVRFLKNNNIQIETNPLTISHKAGANMRRYDYILNSKKWHPNYIDYPYASSLIASSDHSIVVGDFITK